MRIGISNLKRPYGAAVLAALCLAVGPRLRAADCNDNGVEDRVDLQEETSQDCDGNEIPDECDVAGTRLDLGACELISDTAIGFVLSDLDGDSSTDVVLYGPGQPISVFWNDGQGGLVASSPILDHQIVGPLKAFDADGDGKADLTGFSQRGEQRALSVYRSMEGRRELTPAPHTLSLDFAPRDWSFEDLDSDGVPDLVVLDAFLAQVHLGHPSDTTPAIACSFLQPVAFAYSIARSTPSRNSATRPGSPAIPRSPPSQSPAGKLNSTCVRPFDSTASAIAEGVSSYGCRYSTPLNPASAADAKRSTNACSLNIMERFAASLGIPKSDYCDKGSTTPST